MSGLQVEVASRDQSGTQTLDVTALSDSSGKFSFQTYENYSLMISAGGIKCFSRRASNFAKISDTQKIDIQVPSETQINVNVKTQSGVPIPGVEIDLMPMSFGGFDKCESQLSVRTNEAGNSTFPSFVGGFVNPGSYPGAISVHYTPFENVQLTKWTSRIYDQVESFVLDDVPYVEIHAPSIAKTSGFDVTAYVLNPNGLQAINSTMLKTNSFQAAAVRAKFNRVDLYKRSLVKGKWGGWFKHTEVSVDSNGVAKFSKLKFAKGTYQIRFAGLGFTLGSNTKAILVK